MIISNYFYIVSDHIKSHIFILYLVILHQIFISLGGGLPSGLDGMMNNPAMKEAMAKVGGADGLADLMKNPQMMAMAQKMMKDPKVRTYNLHV